MLAGRSGLKRDAITRRVSITVEGIRRRRLSFADAILSILEERFSQFRSSLFSKVPSQYADGVYILRSALTCA